MKENYIKQSPVLTLPSLGGGVGNRLHGGAPESDPWQGIIGTTSNDNPNSIVLDNARNVYVSGNDDGSTFIAKFDNAGVLQWKRKIFCYGYGQAKLHMHAGNTLYIIGTWYNSTYGYDGGWLAKINTGNGLFTWQKSITNQSYHMYFRGICTDPSGNIYTIGYFGTGNNFSCLTIKYDSSANIQWAKTIGGSVWWDLLRGRGIAYSPGDGNNGAGVVFTADLDSYQVGGSYYSSHPYVGKYDLNGNQQWGNAYANSGNDNCRINIYQQIHDNSVACDSSGNSYIVGGEFGSWNNYQTFIMKVNSQGTPQWVRQYGYTHNNTGTSITLDNSENVWVTYYEDHPAASMGESAHLIKLDSSTGMGGSQSPATTEALAHHQWYGGSYPTFTGSAKDSRFNSVQVDGKGFLYVVGRANNFLRASHGYEGAIWKFDPNNINKTSFGTNPYVQGISTPNSPNPYNYDQISGFNTRAITSHSTSTYTSSLTIVNATVANQASTQTYTVSPW